MKIVLAVADRSLGGTSRSALLFAALWRRAGAEVLIYSPEPLHQRRAEAAEVQGVAVTSSLTEVRMFGAAIAHLHHPAPSAATIKWVGAFVAALSEDVVILTHNVFGQPLPVDLGRQVIVGVLGDWVGLQYRLQCWRPSKPVRVLPNPQDLEFFRVPTAEERARARAELGVAPDERVVLRVGSPTEEKWSKAGYASLASAVAATPNVIARFIGAPSTFDFEGPGVTIVHEPVADLALRREYWAADVFAHWANRGESFGNVILEALGTGLPVVYRAVVTRDNTPAEFRDIAGFDYVTRTASWPRRVLNGVVEQRLTLDHRLSRYSADAVGARLRLVVGAHPEGATPEMIRDAVLEALPAPKSLGAREIIAAGLRHNVLTAAVKRLRLRRAR